MLSNNNMLSLGGNQRQRARGTVRVNEPAYGFFVAGSSILGMNGVYVRRNIPRRKNYPEELPIALYYVHEEGLYKMILYELPQAQQEEEEEDDYSYYYRHYNKPKKPTHEWMFIDEFNKKRFSHEGDTIVPGAGVRWKHVHEKPPAVVTTTELAKKTKKKNSKRKSKARRWDEDDDEYDPDSDADSDEDSDGMYDDSDESSEDEEEEAAAQPAASATAAAPSTEALAEVKEDDEDELPWQVIAILDLDMVQQLLWSSEHRKQKVRDAKAGKNAPAASKASLEYSFAPGRWLFRVVAPAGAVLRTAASDDAQEAGKREAGEYLRGVRIDPSGEWLCLDTAEDLAMDMPRGRGQARFDHFYNNDYGRRQLWVRLHSEACASSSEGTGTQTTLVEEVQADETAVLDLRGVGDGDGDGEEEAEVTGFEDGQKASSSSADAAADKAKEARGGHGMTGDLLDKPFVARMEDSTACTSEDSEEQSLIIHELRSGLEDSALAAVKAAAHQQSMRCTGVPVGAVVEISGLKSRAGMQYNGVTGTVVTSIWSGSGRQGVRLDAPFSGKMLACKPDILMYCEPEEDEDDDEDEDDTVLRSSRLLGLQVAQIGLGGTEEELKCADTWGFVGLTPAQRVGAALRSSLRDVWSDVSARAAARAAAETLFAAVHAAESASVTAAPAASVSVSASASAPGAAMESVDEYEPDATPAAAAIGGDAAATTGTEKSPAESDMQPRSPDLVLRSGGLGSRAAAAVVSALSPLSHEERDAGVRGMLQLLKEEVVRCRSAKMSIMVAEGEDSEGGDELLLRLALVQVLLDGRREVEALEEARNAMSYAENSMAGAVNPAANLLLGRCLLRLGQRADGLTFLEKAEAAASVLPAANGVDAAATVTSCRPEWLRSVWEWGRVEAGRLLLAYRASEKCRTAAVDAYSRGGFDDAAALFARCIALLQVGCSDDKRGRAAALADKAGCLRRARKLDDAVKDLDAALRLFPRYTRALFRRAACLLEAGKAEQAVEAFKDLYRVDRDWPSLSEWLVRAFSLKKRQAKGYKTADGVQYEPMKPFSAESKRTTMGADAIAREVDHYIVLGVTTDATEKQLKTAYRMRSLQFHPDRKEGNTAAFQRVAEAYQVLSDADKRAAYDEGGDIKVKRGKRDKDDDESDSDSEPEAEEHKTTMREEVEREFYPERYHFWPFGDPFIYKRKREAQKKAKEAGPGRSAFDDWS